LREALLNRPELFVSTFTEKLMVYALGRRLEAEDMPTVRRIVRDAASDDYKFRALVLGIVDSTQFQQKARFNVSATQAVGRKLLPAFAALPPSLAVADASPGDADASLEETN
jgi:hypothetical protein